MKMKPTNQFEEKIFSFMREHQMLLPGERLVAGISGGADSVCLLFVLMEWKKRYGLELAAVHINHGIRPDAGEDARFVEKLCRENGIAFYLRETDVHVLAKEQKLSKEEAGRNFRYQVFAEVAEEFHADKIAVAHNLNDRCETMLFHLFRGSGLKGLAGILPVRGNVIRPLLNAERSEIEAYLAAKGQRYCQDSTNSEDQYTRNRIRHHILPYAEENIASACVRHMGQTAAILEETEDYLNGRTRDAMAQCVRTMGQDGYVLDVSAFLGYHPAIGKRILLELIKSLSPGAKDISGVHVTDLMELFCREGNRQIDLPFGISGRREYQRMYLECRQKRQVPEDIKLDFQVFSAEELEKNEQNSLIFPENQYTKWFDYDKMIKPPVLRTRRAGDYLMIRGGDGIPHHKKLKDYLVTEKIPAGRREQIPVLAEGSHVIWLVGYRISEYYKVTENTKRVLQVKWISGSCVDNTEEKNGGTY